MDHIFFFGGGDPPRDQKFVKWSKMFNGFSYLKSEKFPAPFLHDQKFLSWSQTPPRPGRVIPSYLKLSQTFKNFVTLAKSVCDFAVNEKHSKQILNEFTITQIIIFQNNKNVLLHIFCFYRTSKLRNGLMFQNEILCFALCNLWIRWYLSMQIHANVLLSDIIERGFRKDEYFFRSKKMQIFSNPEPITLAQIDHFGKSLTLAQFNHKFCAKKKLLNPELRNQERKKNVDILCDFQ